MTVPIRRTGRWQFSRTSFCICIAKINRDATRYNFTWGMGGITFHLFIVLTFTGVLLMFYYHPTKVQAFRDILYLELRCAFRKLFAQHAPLGRAPDGASLPWAAHVVRVVLTGSYKRPANSTGRWASSCWCDAGCCWFTGLSVAGRSTRVLGG